MLLNDTSYIGILLKKGMLLLLACVTCFNCSNDTSRNTGWGNRTGAIEILKVKNVKDFILKDSLFNESRIIKLADIDKGTIGGIDQAIIKDSTIIVLDKYLSKSVFLFHMDGRFLKRLGRKGSGPGEYIQPSNIDLEQDTVFLYDSGNGRINKYLLTGEYVGAGPSARKLNIIPSSVFNTGENYVLFSPYGAGVTKENYALNIIDNKNEVIKSDIPNKSIDNLRINFGISIFKNEEEIVFCHFLNDSVYTLNTETLEISTHYVLDFDNKLLSIESFNKLSQNKSKNMVIELMKMDKSIGVVKVFSNIQYHWLKYLIKGKLINILIDKNTDEVHIFEKVAQSQNDNYILSSLIGSHKDQFIFFNSSELLEARFGIKEAGVGYLILASK